MATTRDVQIKIKVTDDGQALVQIDRLGKGFMTAQKAAKQFEDAIKRQDPVLKGSVADYRRQIQALKTVRDNSAKTSKEFAKQSKAIEQLQIKQRALTEDVKDSNKVNEDQISNAGLAGATLNEFGRTISDLPFGITAITNNLSQLATLFVTLMAKTGGTTKAFKLLGKQMKGPLGLIILFQVLIAGIQKVFGGMSKAEQAASTFNDTLKEQAKVLSLASRGLNNLFLNAEQSQEVVDLLNKTFKELNLELNEFGTLTVESANSLDEFIKTEAKRALIKSLLDDIIEKEGDLLKLRVQADLQAEETSSLPDRIGKGIDKAQAAVYKFFVGAFFGGAEKAKIEMVDLSKEINDLARTLGSSELLKGIKSLFGSIATESIKAREKLKPFVNDLLSPLERTFNQMSNKERISFIEAAFRGITVKQLEIQKAAAAELQKNASIALKGLKQIADANNKAYDVLAKKQQEQFKNQQIAIKELLGAYETFKQAGDLLFDAEISREERKTVLMNNQLRERLKNESLTVKQRESLNNQINANEESLARKRDKLAEKQFKIQKAIAMGEAIITAFISASRAREAVLKGPESFLGIAALPLSQIAYGIILASGLATAAAISRQQFVPSAVGGGAGVGGGSGGAGATIQPPDFNVVGTTAQSQLAETVAGTQSRPVRAFVVGKDITTQQELDRNTRRTASFGG